MPILSPQITLSRPAWEALRFLAGRIGVDSEQLAAQYLLVGLEEIALCESQALPLCKRVIEETLRLVTHSPTPPV